MAADLPDRLATDGYPRIPAGRNVYGVSAATTWVGGRGSLECARVRGEPVKGRNDVQVNAGRLGLRVAVRSLA